MLKVFGRRNAYNVQKVLWTLGEIGIPFEHIDIGSVAGELDIPEFLALNPHGRIPVLLDGETVIWESNTIVRYLAARYGVGWLWPESPALRSLADRWMDWELATLQSDFLALFWGYFRTPPEKRNDDALSLSLARCERHYQKLDSHLAHQPYLGGESFTMGDIPCAVSLYRYFQMGLEVSRPPNVIAWYERLLGRAAYEEHIAVPFEELRGRLEF